MIVKQIDMRTARGLAAKGIEIKLMAPNTPEPEKWTDYAPDTLQNLLDGCLFFRSEPTMDNPVLNEATPIPLVDASPIAKTGDTGLEDRPAVDSRAKRAKVDRGKVLALHKVGRSNKWIAEDMGLHEGTVCRVLKEMKEEQDHEKD